MIIHYLSFIVHCLSFVFYFLLLIIYRTLCLFFGTNKVVCCSGCGVWGVGVRDQLVVLSHEFVIPHLGLGPRFTLSFMTYL